MSSNIIKDSEIYNDNISEISEKSMEHITTYFELKERYFKFLLDLKKQKNSLIRYTIDNVQSNLPLSFIEHDGKYILEIIDDITNDVLYRKTINLDRKINVALRIKQLKKYIDELDIENKKYNLINDLHNIILAKEQIDILRQNKYISDADFQSKNTTINTKKDQLENSIVIFRENYNKYIIELDILNNLLLKNIEQQEHLQNDLYFKILLNYVKQSELYAQLSTNQLPEKRKSIITNYNLINSIIYQNTTNSISSLVFDNRDYKPYYLLEIIDDKNLSTECIDIEGNRVTIENEYIEKYTGIFYKYRNVNLNKTIYVPVNEINNMMSKYGYDNYYNEVDKEDRIEIENIGKKNTYLKDKVNYRMNIESINQPIKSTIIKKKEVVKEKLVEVEKETEIDIVETDYKYQTLYNQEENTIFMFHQMSKTLPYPGEGSSEKIKIEAKEKYSKLFNIKNWRRILANSYISRNKENGNVIIPIVIDGFQFASVEHYYQFSKFYNSPDVDGLRLEQYNKHALRYTLNYQGEDALGESDDQKLLRQVGSEYSGYRVRSDWDKIQKSSMKYKDAVLTKGVFAKFFQQKDLREVLLATEDALLITPYQGNIFTNKFTVAVQHMLVRNMMKNRSRPLDYENFIKDRDSFKIIYEGVYPVVVEDKKPVDIKSPITVINKERDENIEFLKSKGLYQETMTYDEVMNSIISYIDTHENILGKEIEKMEKVVDNMDNKEILDVPPDGDCLYYSIVELLKYYNIHPMNFNEIVNMNGQYSRNTVLLNVGLDKELFKPIHKNAAMELRGDVADKLSSNLSLETEEIELVKASIAEEENSDEFTDDIAVKYLDSIRKTHVTGGRWGGSLELGLISALFNVNINIHTNNGEIIEIKAEDYRKIFPNGKIYNPEKFYTINLGYYTNYHYIGIVDKPEDILEKEELYEDLSEYYYITVDVDDEILNVACQLTNEEAIPLGYINIDNNTIDYFKDNERDNMVFEKVAELIENISVDDERLTKISYYKDIETNYLYTIKDQNKIRIGIVTLNKQKEVILKFNI